MIFSVEISRPFQAKPFRDRQFGGNYVGWLWFAVWAAKGSLGDNMADFYTANIRREIDENGGSVTFYDSRTDPSGNRDTEKDTK